MLTMLSSSTVCHYVVVVVVVVVVVIFVHGALQNNNTQNRCTPGKQINNVHYSLGVSIETHCVLFRAKLQILPFTSVQSYFLSRSILMSAKR